MSRKSRRGSHRRMSAAEAVKASQLIGEQIREKADSQPKPIANPVEIYKNGEWKIVDKSDYDFPFPFKLTLTPTWCLSVLENRNPLNRRIQDTRVEKYARSILNKEWETINNGFGFYEDGTLADGQHRLWAIVESAQPVDAIVVFGMKKSAMTAIDEGKSRTNVDVGRLMGLDVTNSKISTTNFILEMKGIKQQMSRQQLLDFYETHTQAVTFVSSRINVRGVAKAPIMAPIVRAWYNVDRSRLARFCEILQSGIINNDTETAAFRLRDWLIQTKSNNSGTFRIEVYQKTESALVYFFDGRPMTKLTRCKEEQFPLPHERVGSPV